MNIETNKFVNEFLVTWNNHELNQVFKLINKILLFQYSEGIFLVHKRAATLTLPHDIQLNTFFSTPYNLSQDSSFSQR